MTFNIIRTVTSRGFQAGVFVPFLYSILASLGLLMSLWRTGDIQLDQRNARNTKSGEYGQTFDFIIGD